MDTKAAIQISELSKSYGGKAVLFKCSLSVEAGTIYGLLGKNGAGKTTLFKLMLGLARPVSGTVEILGMDSQRKLGDILKKTGVLIETPVFYEALPAKENLRIFLSYMEAEENMEKRIEEALEMTGLSMLCEEPVSTFSQGMRQRLAIARAIIHKPEVLILDEPLNGLDPAGIREMRDLFLHLARVQKTTILFSSHILSEVEKTADCIGVLVNGRIREELTREDVEGRLPEGLEEHFLKLTEGGEGAWKS